MSRIKFTGLTPNGKPPRRCLECKKRVRVAELYRYDKYPTKVCRACDTIVYYFESENREDIEFFLSKHGFKYLDCSGNQYCCRANGRYDLFKVLLDVICREEGYKVDVVKCFWDPGLGMEFDGEIYEVPDLE